MYEKEFGMERTPFVRNIPPEQLYESPAMREALSRLQFAAARQLFAVVTADAGCGKSTLLSLLSGLNRAKAGEIRMDGKVVRGLGPDRAVVFQQYSLLPWLTAKGNVMFAIRQSGRKYTRK